MNKRLFISLLASALLAACGDGGDDSVSAPAAQSGSNASQQTQVEVNEKTISLKTADAGVIVERLPFRMRFVDGQGKPVLNNVANPAAQPTPELAIEPELTGSETLPDNSLYAPLVFETGLHAVPEMPASPWVGNVILGLRAGMQFSAQEVIEVEQLGDHLRLVLSTNDPTGRIINLDIQPAEQGSVEVKARVEPSPGVVWMSSSFDLAEDEAFYGFGGRHNAVNQRGEEFINYLQSQNTGAGPLQPIPDNVPGLQGETYMFPSGEHAAFYVHASFTSSAGYGFFLDNFELSMFRLGAANPDAWQAAVAAPEMSFLVVPGDEPEAVKKITGINGRHRVPPEFALGPTLSRTIRVLSPEQDDAASYEAKIRDDIAMIDATGLPIRAYTFEGFELLSDETTRELIEMLHERGIAAYLYIRNYVGIDAANTERPETFTEAVSRGYVANTALGTPFFYGTTFIAGIGAAIDFTLEPAVQWWRGRLRRMVDDLGADGFMQDFGEQILDGMHFSDGSTGETMHNAYSNLFHRVTREFLEDYKAETGRDIFFFTRAGYSGRPGAAAFENANFPGDETTDWSRASGLAALTTDMLSRAVGGSFGYDTDIGGYIDTHVPATTKELFIRWAQWASLSTGGRVHNSFSSGVNMPWSYDEEALEAYRKAAQLKIKALPLIRELWAEGQESGLPPTRPLWLHYPDDPRARNEDQQWLLGPDALVAPVVIEGAVTRDVYLPDGCWRHVDSGQQFAGPADITVDAPLDSLPYFFRCGTQPF